MINRKALFGAIAGLAVVQGALSQNVIFPRWRQNYSTDSPNIAGGLAPDQMLVALAGFREMIAGILWVRADSFFDSGNYDAILPIIRLVTVLDPKQIDVYSTGMWHIAYNFTDEESRSDRRYVPTALALGSEGARQNKETYELFFETGWLWYHKIDDNYGKAVYWWEQAQKRPDILPARQNILAMAYQRNGQIQKGLEHYFSQYDKAAAIAKVQEDFGAFQQRDVNENNIDTMIVRMGQRGVLGPASKTSNMGVPYDIDPPFDVGFSAQLSVISPRVIRVRATWNVRPVGTRIRMILRDSDYPNAVPGGLNWDFSNNVQLDPPRDRTFMQDQLFVRNQRSERKIDMSRDPTMYPFTSKDYTVEFYYNPRSAPPHIQDKFGWSGEGMTDKNFLNTTIRPGQRVVYTTLKLTREQILRTGQWRDKVPVIQTKNFELTENFRNNDQAIKIPGLRGTTPNPGDQRTQSLRDP
ncbi:MAG: hypothetical protein JNK63_11540 [Chthonomonas sp.]|nr:hypothetical protein [Chthonomonas sp.]